MSVYRERRSGKRIIGIDYSLPLSTIYGIVIMWLRENSNDGKLEYSKLDARILLEAEIWEKTRQDVDVEIQPNKDWWWDFYIRRSGKEVKKITDVTQTVYEVLRGETGTTI